MFRRLNISKLNIQKDGRNADGWMSNSNDLWIFWISDQRSNRTGFTYAKHPPVLMSKETARLENAKNYRDWKSDHPEKFKLFIQKIIRSDINAVISEADYLICLWDKFVIKGGGTHAEVTFAYWYKKPVYLISKVEK